MLAHSTKLHENSKKNIKIECFAKESRAVEVEERTFIHYLKQII